MSTGRKLYFIQTTLDQWEVDTIFKALSCYKQETNDIETKAACEMVMRWLDNTVNRAEVHEFPDEAEDITALNN